MGTGFCQVTYSHMLYSSYGSDVVDVCHHILKKHYFLKVPICLNIIKYYGHILSNLHCGIPGWVIVCEEVGEEVDHDNAAFLSHHL